MIIISGCEKDNPNDEPEVSLDTLLEEFLKYPKGDIGEAKEMYSQNARSNNKINFQTSRENSRQGIVFEPNWEEFSHIDIIGNQEQYVGYLDRVPVEIDIDGVISNLAILQQNDQLEEVLLIFVPSEHQDDDELDGNLFINNPNGEFIRSLKIVDEVITNIHEPKTGTEYAKYTKNDISFSIDGDDECNGPGCLLGQGEEVVVYGSSSDYYIDFYFNDITCGSQQIIDWAEPTTFISCEPSCSRGSPNPNMDDDEDERIDNNLSNPCASGILTELREVVLNEDSLKPEILIDDGSLAISFSNSILSLFNDFRFFNYVIEEKKLFGKNAKTDFPKYDILNRTFSITTTINSDYLLQATELAVARTIIHESIRAYLLYQQRGNPDRDLYNSLIKFANDNGYGTEDPNRLHHEFMAQYVSAIAYSLKQWDLIYGSGGNLPWDYYKSMAYGGMFTVDNSGNFVSQTDAFMDLVDVEEREVVKDIILSENKSDENSRGTNCN